MKENENMQDRIAEEVKKYENDKNISKDYYESMTEISAWLEKLGKS